MCLVRLVNPSQSSLWFTLDGLHALKQGADAIKSRQRRRLTELVAYARTHSPFYRALYRDLPERMDDPSRLPVTDKQILMAAYDEWATDRDVTLESVLEIADDPQRTGDYLLGRYTVRATSGTTGVRGLFVTDKRSEVVDKALAFRSARQWLDLGDIARIIGRGGRMGFVVHGSGHGAASIEAIRRRRALFGHRRFAMFSLQSPLNQLVEELNRFRPAVLLSYATEAPLLANEQEAGRLRVAPSLVVLTGEGLAPPQYERIRTAFQTRVVNVYASNECSFMTYSCPEDRLHVNSDWAILEPVDGDFRPVAPDQESHTLLITNLANRVQPILRYDIGDRAALFPDPCPCGNPLPTIRIQGRVSEVLTIPDSEDKLISLPPGVFGELNHIPGMDTFQIVQAAPAVLRFRFRPRPGADTKHVGRIARVEAERILADHDIENVAFELADELPQVSDGGKMPRILPLRQ